jgi:fermentation-respiration switch protein FrsA (DUF1100 family)
LNKDQLLRSFFFQPERGFMMTPDQLGLDHEDIVFRTEDGSGLHGWYISNGRAGEHPPAQKVIILMMHGVAGNISHRVESAAALCRELDANAFLFDYRGYGRSSGEPTEEGTYKDAQAAFYALCRRPEVDPKHIVLFGHSLGGAVAIDLAVHLGSCILGLVVESSFTTGREIARLLLPIVPGNMVPDFYDSQSKIGEVQAPVLITHAEDDELLPTAMGEALFEAARQPKFYYSVPGAGHSDIHRVGGAPYFEQWRRFIDFCRDWCRIEGE